MDHTTAPVHSRHEKHQGQYDFLLYIKHHNPQYHPHKASCPFLHLPLLLHAYDHYGSAVQIPIDLEKYQDPRLILGDSQLHQSGFLPHVKPYCCLLLLEHHAALFQLRYLHYLSILFYS